MPPGHDAPSRSGEVERDTVEVMKADPRFEVLPQNAEPSVGVDSARHLAYVVNNIPETVSVIDGDPASPTANTVVATIPVGSSPGVVGVNRRNLASM